MLKVLSLFDGMSCGAIALHELGVPVKYYASEIDKHAIRQTQLNFPNTIQLGSVVNVDVSQIDPIDLLIGGSPCQSFSFAGKRKGMAVFQKPKFKKPTRKEWEKYISDQNRVMYEYEDFVNFMEEQHELRTDESFMEHVEIYTLEKYLELKEQGFEFEGQSYLFWEYMRILTDIRKYNPDVLFLLENVEMGKKWERTLSEAIGVFGVHINSALVSAQNRKRIYWTNIRTKQVGLFGELHSDIPQPKDRGILLKDILEQNVPEKYFLSDKMIAGLQSHSDKKQSEGCGFKFEPKDQESKGSAITARCFKMGVDDNYIVAMRGRNPENPSDRTTGIPTEQRLEPKTDGKTNCLISVAKDNLVMIQRGHGFNNGGEKAIDGKTPLMTKSSWEQNNLLMTQNYLQITGTSFDSDNRFWKEEGKHASVLTRGADKTGVLTQSRIRRLTPTECSRLQTIPDWYKWGCSDTQIYRMCGNGWTVEVIKHILSFGNFKSINQYEQTK